MSRTQKMSASLKLRRDSLRSRPRRERRLGGKGIRTPGLLIANETLYQLSYTPVLPMKTGLNKSGKNFRCPPLLHTAISLYGQNTAQTRRATEGWRGNQTFLGDHRSSPRTA